jgi:hypothetical protein
MQSRKHRPGSTAASECAPRTDVRQAARSEDIHIRNYDRSRSYDLTVTVHGDGDPLFEASYHLYPGQVGTVSGVLDPAEYRVTVEFEDGPPVRAECRVSNAPEHTVYVQVGNGLVSVSDGRTA